MSILVGSHGCFPYAGKGLANRPAGFREQETGKNVESVDGLQ